MCFAIVYCKQTKVGLITHHILHLSFFVGYKTLRWVCFVCFCCSSSFSKGEVKSYFPEWHGVIFSFKILILNLYGLLKMPM
jgi:hypothetical protein